MVLAASHGQNFVPASASEALKIERDVSVTQLLEGAKHFFSQRLFKQARHVLGGDLDASDLGMMADAEVGKSTVVKEGFAALDLREHPDGDGGAVGDAAGEAGEGGVFPIRDCERPGEAAGGGVT